MSTSMFGIELSTYFNATIMNESKKNYFSLFNFFMFHISHNLELKAIKAKFMGYKTSTGARRFYPGLPKEQAAVKQLELAVA